MPQTPEEKKEYHRKYRVAHREARREYNKGWRKTNPEKVKATKAKFCKAHPDTVNAANRKYRSQHLETSLARVRAWHKIHPDRVTIARYKKKYGLSSAEAEQLYVARQTGVCAACGGNRSKKALAVDHDHDTKVIRGLLCDKCNLALGHMAENPVWLQNLTDYAQRAQDTKRDKTDE